MAGFEVIIEGRKLVRRSTLENWKPISEATARGGILTASPERMPMDA